MFIINKSAEEKLCNIHSVSVVTQGAGTPPFRDDAIASILGDMMATASDHPQTVIEENRRQA